MPYRVILAETSLSPEQTARYYSEGGLGANSVISNAFTSPSRRSGPELALDFYGAILFAPQDMTPTWVVRIMGKIMKAKEYSNLNAFITTGNN